MIGNDVVNLELSRIESNWQRKGFLDKVFTTKEQNFIKKSNNKESAVWSLWSRKEAAYKIWNRATGTRKLNAIQFECQDYGLEIGLVKFEEKIYYTKTALNIEFIHTVAVSTIENFDKIKIIDNSIAIEKQNGLPFYIDEKQQIQSISKSHHGQFEFIVALGNS